MDEVRLLHASKYGYEVLALTDLEDHDHDIRLDYADAIQVGVVCGGRYGKKPRPYVLTYYPEGDPDRGRWFLTFDRTEIEDISDGRMAEITLYCCTSPECRCKFREQNDYCFYCDYADDPNFGTFNFPEAQSKLAERGIGGLSENSTKEEVIKALGPPDGSGGGIEHPPLGYIWPWTLYRFVDCQLRFEFNTNSTRIRSINIMERDWEPGK